MYLLCHQRLTVALQGLFCPSYKHFHAHFLFLLHSILKGFCLRSLTPLAISASLSLSLRKEKLFIFLKKFYGLGGKELASCRALRGRSKKENNPVSLAFPGCPKHPSTADIDKKFIKGIGQPHHRLSKHIHLLDKRVRQIHI